MGAVPIVVQDNTNAKLFEGLPVWRVKSYGNISYEEVENNTRASTARGRIGILEDSTPTFGTANSLTRPTR